MNSRRAEVRLSENFDRNLDDIEQFLVDAGVPHIFDDLLDGLVSHVIPNLEDFPEMGPSFMAHPGNSVEIMRALEGLRRRLPPGVDLRQCLWSDYLFLYAWDGKVVNLLSIKHHRQLSFDLNSRWK